MSAATATERTAVAYERLAGASDLDRLVFEVDDPWALDVVEQDRLRLGFVREAMTWHLDRSAAFRAFATRRGFDPAVLRTVADLDRVPQVPTTCFKRTEVASLPAAAMTKRCTSSGTMGTTSVVWRDRTTLERLLGSVRRSVALAGDWHDDELEVVNLGPDAEEAADLWISYVIGLAELLFPTTHCVAGGRLDLALAAAALDAALAEGRAVALVGPPALLAAFAARVGSTARPPGRDRVVVMSAGGWKSPTGAPITPAAFRREMVEALGLAGEDQVRDAFNQVELNTVVSECAEHRKHVPPWLHVTARDPTTLAPLPAGAVGLLSYLDPTATSYPCFLVADDFGTVEEGGCPCGRRGRVLRVLRRVEREESWGCALKLARTHGVEVP